MISADASDEAAATAQVLDIATQHILSYLQQAHKERRHHQEPQSAESASALNNPLSYSPDQLKTTIQRSLEITAAGTGVEGFEQTLSDLFAYSVNTSAPGFLDKL